MFMACAKRECTKKDKKNECLMKRQGLSPVKKAVKNVLNSVILKCQSVNSDFLLQIHFLQCSWTLLPRNQICYLVVCLVYYVEFPWLLITGKQLELS